MAAQDFTPPPRRPGLLKRAIRKILTRLLGSRMLAVSHASVSGSALDPKFQAHKARMSTLAARPGSGRLAGKVAFVTGAASGIGRAIAVLFAREGARVVVADINTPGGEETVAQITTAGGTAVFMSADVTSDASVEAAVARTKEVFGEIHLLVNNAGVNVEGGLLTLPPGRWEHALELNLTSSYRCCRAAVPEIIRAGGGSVIIMASVQGVAGFLDSSAYAAAKGALISLTRQLARQFAAQGVRVNAVSPGVVRTPIFDRVANPGQMFEIVSNHTPAGFIGVPEDIAFATLFLASDESAYITGINLVVDGGMTMRGV